MKRDTLVAMTAAFAMLFGLPSSSFAWTKKGHGVVARIAEYNLTPAARAHVRELLNADGAKDMADVASWADNPEVKSRQGRPMHTVRLSMDSASYNTDKDCPARNCIVEAIKRSEALLSDPTIPVTEQIIALKDLIHFVGDIHQPLHTVNNIGGQRVVLNGQGTTLHEVWDKMIISDQRLSNSQLARLINGDSVLAPFVGGTPDDWATEGRDIAMKEIYAETAPTTRRAAPSTLAQDYTQRHWPTVERRLKQAGLRLADILNRVYARS